MKKKTQYPVYFRRNVCAYFCLLNEKEAIHVGLYGDSTSIEYEVKGNGNGTWIHNTWTSKLGIRNKYVKTTKSDYEKALNSAMKILREKLKT